MKKAEVQKLKKALEEIQTILCVSHETPDGDTLASSLAMGLALKKIGKKVDFYCKDPVPFNFGFLPGAAALKTNPPRKNYDLILGFDAGSRKRLFIEGINYKTLGCIDHHRYGDLYGDMNLVTFGASSTGEVVFDLLKSLKIPLDKDIASNLYVCIYTDTGGFKYSSTSPKCFRTAASLLKYKVDPWDIFANIYENNPINRLRLLSEVLSSLEIDANGQLAVISFSEKLLEKYDASYDMVDGFINYARSLKGVEVAMMLFETSNAGLEVSFRSKGRVNVGKVAQSLGGGGHKNAGGARLKGKLCDLKDALLNQVREELERV